MKYATKITCQSNQAIDFTAAKETLLPNSFRVINKNDTSIEFVGRGMNSTKEDAIRGATKISLYAQDGELHLDANLGGVRFMVLFVCLFPPLLILSLSYFNESGSSVINHLWVWLIMGPIISYWVRRRTISSLDTMLKNTVSFQPKI